MADLVADLNATEQKLAADIEGLKVPPPPPQDLPPPPKDFSTVPASSCLASPTSSARSTSSNVSAPASPAASPLPPPPSQSSKPTKVSQFTACKIKEATQKVNSGNWSKTSEVKVLIKVKRGAYLCTFRILKSNIQETRSRKTTSSHHMYF